MRNSMGSFPYNNGYFVDEINENHHLNKNPLFPQRNVMESVVSRDHFPIQNHNKNQFFHNNYEGNGLASAPERIQAMDNNSLNLSEFFQSLPQQQQPNFTNFNDQLRNPHLNPNINARYNTNMNEAQYFQDKQQNYSNNFNENRIFTPNKQNNDAMALEIEPISEFNSLNINGEDSSGTQGQQLIPTQSIHINNLNIQNSNLHSQYTNYSPQNFTAFNNNPNSDNQSGIPQDLFFQNQEHFNEMRNSHKFGQLSQFPDKRNRSVSPLPMRKSPSQQQQSQLTPKANQKLQENIARLEQIGTRRKPQNYGGFLSRNFENSLGN